MEVEVCSLKYIKLTFSSLTPWQLGISYMIKLYATNKNHKLLRNWIYLYVFFYLPPFLSSRSFFLYREVQFLQNSSMRFPSQLWQNLTESLNGLKLVFFTWHFSLLILFLWYLHFFLNDFPSQSVPLHGLRPRSSI